MPYLVKLKESTFPLPRLRDGKGHSAPVRTLSSDVPVVFDSKPAEDNMVEIVTLDAAEAAEWRKNEAELQSKAIKLADERHAKAKAKIAAQLGRVAAPAVAVAVEPEPSKDTDEDAGKSRRRKG